MVFRIGSIEGAGREMLKYFLKRLGYMLPVALGVSIVCFSLVHIAPGDPITALTAGNAPKETVEEIKRAYGLDRPLPVQYAVWLGKVTHGDLGRSISNGRPVAREVIGAVGNTLILALTATVLAFSLGAILGTVAGYRQGTTIDRLATSVGIFGVSMPHYWLGMVLVILFAVEFGSLPALGIGPHGLALWEWNSNDFAHVVLPAITMAVIPLGIITRTVRAVVAEILGHEFVQALRAKGLRERRIFLHVVKNAAPTALAVMGIQLGYLLGGSILVETVFAWPGTGLLMNNAIFQRDIPLLQGTVLVLAMFFVVLNLMVDILQPLIDPRIRRT
jgi:peptide/nickel transport system permease protein